MTRQEVLVHYMGSHCNSSAGNRGDALPEQATRGDVGQQVLVDYMDCQGTDHLLFVRHAQREREICERWGFICKCERCVAENSHLKKPLLLLSDVEMAARACFNANMCELFLLSHSKYKWRNSSCPWHVQMINWRNPTHRWLFV